MKRGQSTRNLGPWFRSYVSILDDPKLARLSDAQYRCWHKLVALAKFHGGTIPPDIRDTAHRLRVTDGKARDTLQIMVSAKLFDLDEHGYTPHNWNERQFVSDSSTERVRQFREQSRNVSTRADETFHSAECNVSETVNETSPEAEAEADSETEAEEKTTSLRSVSKKRTALPDACPDHVAESWAVEHWSGHGRADLANNIHTIRAQFRDHHAAKGTRAADWPATWRTWVRNAIKFEKPPEKQRISAHDKGTLGLVQFVANAERSADATDSGGGAGTARNPLPANGHGPAQVADDGRRFLVRLPTLDSSGAPGSVPALPHKP